MAASLAYVPFALSDEQYAAILRAPQAHGYSVNAHPPAAHAGSVGMFGALYLFKEAPEARARVAASTSLLSDGATALARLAPTKQAGAGNSSYRTVTAYSLFIREEMDSCRRDQPDADAAAVRKESSRRTLVS